MNVRHVHSLEDSNCKYMALKRFKHFPIQNIFKYAQIDVKLNSHSEENNFIYMCMYLKW